MTKISAKLIKDGNSVAIRLPKTVLTMSGLRDEVMMDVKPGQIVLSATHSPRVGWRERIAKAAATNPLALSPDSELDDWEVTSSDGLE